MGMENEIFRYQKVKQDLLQEIRHMAPDSRLKSRPQLVKQYDVTRTTIGKAVSELIGEGYNVENPASGQNANAALNLSFLYGS